jgi:hypothetical protein
MRKPKVISFDPNPLTDAFKELRANGYFARQNFWCCQSCAWADIPKEKAKKAVFYHNQDRDDLQRTGKTMLAWSGDSKFICQVLEKHGVKVNHDGSSNTRIEVDLRKE